MKILFYDTQNYDRESFDRTKEQFPEIEVEYLKTGLAARTASLAKGYDAVCAFVNSDVGTKTVEALHEAGVKLILMRCAGFNNVDLKTAAKYGIDVRRVPGYSPEAVAEHAMTLAMTVNRHTVSYTHLDVYKRQGRSRTMLEKIKEILVEQLNCDADSINEDTSFKDDLGADSLDLYEMVMALEDEYGIEIDTDELTDLSTVGDFMEYLKQHGVEV